MFILWTMKQGHTIYKEDQTDRSLLLVGVTKVVQNEEINLGYFQRNSCQQNLHLDGTTSRHWSPLWLLKGITRWHNCILDVWWLQLRFKCFYAFHSRAMIQWKHGWGEHPTKWHSFQNRWRSKQGEETFSPFSHLDWVTYIFYSFSPDVLLSCNKRLVASTATS